MGSVAGFCDRGNEPSGYTKGGVSSPAARLWDSQEDACFRQLALLCACVMTYCVKTPDRQEFWKWRNDSNFKIQYWPWPELSKIHYWPWPDEN